LLLLSISVFVLLLLSTSFLVNFNIDVEKVVLFDKINVGISFVSKVLTKFLSDLLNLIFLIFGNLLSLSLLSSILLELLLSFLLKLYRVPFIFIGFISKKVVIIYLESMTMYRFICFINF